MTTWWTKLRGFLGLASAGAVVGGVLGCAVLVWLELRGYDALTLANVLGVSGLYGSLGAVTTSVLAGALAVLESGKSVAELSLWRAGTWGAIGGAVASLLVLAVVLAVTGGEAWGVLSFMETAAVGGGALGLGVVATARRAARKELAAGGDLDALSAPDS